MEGRLYFPTLWLWDWAWTWSGQWDLGDIAWTKIWNGLARLGLLSCILDFCWEQDIPQVGTCSRRLGDTYRRLRPNLQLRVEPNLDQLNSNHADAWLRKKMLTVKCGWVLELITQRITMICEPVLNINALNTFIFTDTTDTFGIHSILFKSYSCSVYYIILTVYLSLWGLFSAHPPQLFDLFCSNV